MSGISVSWWVSTLSEAINMLMKNKPGQLQATRNMRVGFGLTILSLVIFVLAFSWTTWQTEKQDEFNELSLLAELSGKSINAYFAHFENSLSVLSEELLDAEGALNLERTQARLKRFREIHSEIANVNLADINGQVLASAVDTPGVPLPNVSQMPTFIAARDAMLKGQAFYIGRPTIGRIVQVWQIPMRYGVRDKNGNLRYILNAPLPLATQQSFWQSIYLPTNARMGLIRDDSYLISVYPTPPPAALEENYGKIRNGALAIYLRQHHFPSRGIAEGYNPTLHDNFNYAYYRLPNHALTFFIATPISRLRTEWWKHNQAFYLLTILFTISGVCIYSWVVRRNLLWDAEKEQDQEKFRSIYEGSNDAIVLLTPECFLDCNQRTLEIFGIKNKAQFMSYAPLDLSPARQPDGQDTALVADHYIQIASKQGSARFEWVCRRINGEEFPAEVLLSTFHFNGKRILQGTVRDITDRKAAQERVEFLAYHDFLTGLPNRLLSKKHFELAVSFADREATKVALIFLDLDNFKIINDSLGHGVGDALLKVVASRLQQGLRDSDTLSRQGGDEFLIVLSGADDEAAIRCVAEKTLAQLGEIFSIEGNELSTSLSIGIAVYPDDGKDYDTLLKKADTAMYQAKEAGRNTYRFYAEQMNVDAVEYLQIRNNLRRGLEREEFVLHYQPQIDLSNNAIIGAEALIRWNHSEFGLIPPGRFIGLAEESGLIVQIGEWVLHEACRQAIAWQAAGLPELVIAVNLSAVQFKRGDLEKSVINALTNSGLAPALLELELTESILIQDTEKVLAMVRRLKALGVKLSLDDFGTGYSSLSYLKTFAVDKVKIDQSFVRDMADDPNDAVIVRTIIQMAKSLNLKTIAEGVETERQLALLHLQRCDEAQGYFFARPMPAEAFSRYLTSA
jgi:diguanylate cyclase (GGDEF)-like protein/PAS domain S-box-containing protein